MIKIWQTIEGFGAEGVNLGELLGKSSEIEISVEDMFKKLNEMKMHGFIIQKDEKYFISPN